MFRKPQPLQLVEKVRQYTSNLYGSTPPICIAVLSWLLSFEERETLQYTSHLYCSTPPICTAVLLEKYWGLGVTGTFLIQGMKTTRSPDNFFCCSLSRQTSWWAKGGDTEQCLPCPTEQVLDLEEVVTSAFLRDREVSSSSTRLEIPHTHTTPTIASSPCVSKQLRAACLQNELPPKNFYKSIRKTVWKTRKRSAKRSEMRPKTKKLALLRPLKSISPALFLGARLRGRMVTQRSKRGSEKVLGRVLGKGFSEGFWEGGLLWVLQ